jgi:hypothetical protein
VAIRAEGVFSLAAGVGLPGLTTKGKTETLSKTRFWGFGEKKLPSFQDNDRAKRRTALRMQKSSWKTVSGSPLDSNGNPLTDAIGMSYTCDFETRTAQAESPAGERSPSSTILSGDASRSLGRWDD